MLHQLGPLHRRYRPVQLRAPDDAPPRRSDPRRRLGGVRLPLTHPNTPRSLHDSVTARQTRCRQQRVLVQGLSACVLPLAGALRIAPRLSVNTLKLILQLKYLQSNTR